MTVIGCPLVMLFSSVITSLRTQVGDAQKQEQDTSAAHQRSC